jgi:hypothetical protein
MMGVAVGAIIVYGISTSPDFIISMADISDKEINTNFTLIQYIDIENAHYGINYRYPILLGATLLNGTTLPPNFKVDFDPAYIFELPSRSKMTIIGENVNAGDYKMKIIANGGEGLEHSCPYIIIVKNIL